MACPDKYEHYELQLGLEAALKQLSVLPAGSTIRLAEDGDYLIMRGVDVFAAAVAAAAPWLGHITVVSPCVRGSGENIRELLQHAHVFPHVRVRGRWDNDVAEMAGDKWPWVRLEAVKAERYDLGIAPGDLLELPDPTSGQYELSVWGLDFSDAHEV